MNILVLAPHPDDEAIGVGGTIKRHKWRGDYVKVIFVTSGESAPEITGPQREEEAEAAALVLGYDEHEFWHFPDGAVGTRMGELQSKLCAEFETYYDAVYIPHESDTHPDHYSVNFAAMFAFRTMKENTPLPDKILQYEVWTPILRHTTINQITEQVEDKLAAIRAHKSQSTRNRFDLGAIGLNKFRAVTTGWPQGYVEVFEEVTL